MFRKCPGDVPEKIETIKGGWKMGLEMEGVGLGEPAGVPGGPQGAPGGSLGPQGGPGGPRGARGGGGRGEGPDPWLPY